MRVHHSVIVLFLVVVHLAQANAAEHPLAPVLQSFVDKAGWCGARAMWVDPTNELVMILLVERFNMPADQQKVMYGSFMKAAVAKYWAAAARRTKPLLKSS